MLNKRAWNLLWVSIEKAGMVIISVVTFFIYARLLGPEEMGMALFALSVGQGIGVIFVSLLEDPLVRKEKVFDIDYASAWWGGLVASIGASLIVMMIVWFGSDNPRFIALILLSVLHIPLMTLGHVYVADLRRRGKFKSLAKRTLIARLGGAACGMLLAWAGFGSYALISHSVLIALVSLLIMWRSSELSIPWKFNYMSLKDLLITGWPLALRGASWDTMIRGVTIILGITSGPAAVGLFGLARRMIDMPRNAIYGGLLSYALPAYSRHQADLPKLQSMFTFSTLVTCFILVPMFVGLALIAPFAIPALFGSEWEPAVPLIQILAGVAAVGNTLVYVPTVLTALARHKMTLPADLLAALAAVLFTTFLGSSWGAYAAATSFIVYSLIASPAKVICLHRALGISPLEWLKTVYKSVVSSVIMVLSVLCVLLVISKTSYSDLNPLITTCLMILSGMVSYLMIYTLLHKSWFVDLKSFFIRS